MAKQYRAQVKELEERLAAESQDRHDWRDWYNDCEDELPKAPEEQPQGASPRAEKGALEKSAADLKVAFDF